MKTACAWLIPCLLACSVALGASDAAAPPAVEIARSALLTLSGTAEPAVLRLAVRRSAEQAPLLVTEFTATLDGKPATATRAADGTWSVPLVSLTAGEHQLAVTVGHDGIRELLEGKFRPTAAVAPAAGVSGLGANHKQLLWWVLNIGIVLVAVLAISRRMS